MEKFLVLCRSEIVDFGNEMEGNGFVEFYCPEPKIVGVFDTKELAFDYFKKTVLGIFKEMKVIFDDILCPPVNEDYTEEEIFDSNHLIDPYDENCQIGWKYKDSGDNVSWIMTSVTGEWSESLFLLMPCCYIKKIEF